MPSVLLVDDRSENLLTLEAILEPLVVRTVRAASAADALSRVDEEQFAVILLDVQMPGTDGIEAARLIKERENGRIVPILFITALDRERRRLTSAYEAGAVDYMLKPLDPDEFRAKVSGFLDLHRMQARDRDRRRRYADQRVSRSEDRYRQAADTAERALAALEIADRSKTEFLSRMSHELRTPLNAILGYIQLLDIGILGAITPEQHTHLNRVRQSAVHLLSLVNEILDLVTLERAELRLRRDVARVGDLCEAALTLVRIEATMRNLTVTGLAPGDLGATYVGDPDRVRQVLVHLLMNAIKFTPPGGHVTISCGTSGAGKGTSDSAVEPDTPLPGRWAYVRVTDDGIGIAPQDLERIFEAFTQVDGGRTRAEGGTGLGLTISRRLAQAMGGDVTVRSEPGRGAAFTLWLPTPEDADDAEPVAKATPRAAPRASVRPPSVVGSVGRSEARHGTAHGTDTAGEREDRSGTTPTYRAIGLLGTVLASQIETITREHCARLRTDGSLPNVGTLPMAQLRDHVSTLVNEVAEVLMVTGESEGRAPELLRDGGEILRLVAELHGAQRQRLGWSEAHVTREVELLQAELEERLQRGAAEDSTNINALEQAMLLVSRVLEQSRQASFRTFRLAQQADVP